MLGGIPGTMEEIVNEMVLGVGEFAKELFLVDSISYIRDERVLHESVAVFVLDMTTGTT
jgi:hypothetical protein